jgi:hypothetical protein
MRSDMPKVLVERPRGGGYGAGRGDARERQRTPIEEWRGREGMKRRWNGGTKWFSDHLGPIRRFLRSNIGRPWDNVYSEICTQLRGKFPDREHFLLHIYQYVERDVSLINGIPCHRGGHNHGEPLRSYGRGFYVCPRTGLLRAIPKQQKRP